MDITMVAIAGMVVGGAVSLGAFTAWLRYRVARVARVEAAATADRLARLAADVQALHTSVEALAVEVERIGEGQRYALRLLDGGQGTEPPNAIALEHVTSGQG